MLEEFICWQSTNELTMHTMLTNSLYAIYAAFVIISGFSLTYIVWCTYCFYGYTKMDCLNTHFLTSNILMISDHWS